MSHGIASSCGSGAEDSESLHVAVQSAASELSRPAQEVRVSASKFHLLKQRQHIRLQEPSLMPWVHLNVLYPQRASKRSASLTLVSRERTLL